MRQSLVGLGAGAYAALGALASHGLPTPGPPVALVVHGPAEAGPTRPLSTRRGRRRSVGTLLQWIPGIRRSRRPKGVAIVVVAWFEQIGLPFRRMF